MIQRSVFALAACLIGAALTDAHAQQPVPPPLPSAELFSEPNFRGQRLLLTGTASNLDRAGFNDRARSVRVSGAWIFCEDSEFDDRCVALDRDEPNLAAVGLDSRISSARPKQPDVPVLTPPPPPGGQRDAGFVTLYSGRNFTGRSLDIRSPDQNIGVAAQSLIARGRWTVCDREAFVGTCQTFSGEVADLSRTQLSGFIGSAHPSEARGGGPRPGSPPPPPRFEDDDFVAEGTTASFFPRPTRSGRAVPACETSRSGGDCARISADRFCQQVGYARSAYFYVRSGRRSQTLEDVLCLR